jgi:hypothetical protein
MHNKPCDSENAQRILEEFWLYYIPIALRSRTACDECAPDICSYRTKLVVVGTCIHFSAGLGASKNMKTFGINDGAKAVDQDDFRLLLSAVEGEVVEGTGRNGAGAGAADLLEGQGSDKAQMSSTSA